MVFVQYPNHYDGDGVAPSQDAADALLAALKNDQPITLTGDAGVGSEADPNAPATQTPPAGTPATDAPATGAPATDAPSTDAPTQSSSGAVDLPSTVHRQTADQYTCSKPFSD
jgi:hypothetical protein